VKGDRRYGSLTAEPPERAGPQDAGDESAQPSWRCSMTAQESP
jgi:hypothetical protein